MAPGNPARGLERIQALYVLFDAATLTPSAVLDGAALTTLRTPAVSAVAIDCLAPQEVSHVVIIGSGPQAVGHAEAILAIRTPTSITVVGRQVERATVGREPHPRDWPAPAGGRAGRRRPCGRRGGRARGRRSS